MEDDTATQVLAKVGSIGIPIAVFMFGMLLYDLHKKKNAAELRLAECLQK